MARYIIKRLITMIFIIIGVAFVVYTIMEFTPGDPAVMMLGDNSSPEDIKAFNEKYGLDKPFLVRFFNYVIQLYTHLDFGVSWLTSRPILGTLLERVPHTLIIAISSIAFASLIGVLLGVVSAVRQYSALDYISRITAMVMAAVPVFWLGMLLTILFALRLGWLPASGVGSWKNFVLPMLTLGLPYSARILRSTRSYMLEAVRQDFVRTARAKGVPEKVVVWKHAFNNACLPIINTIGVYIGGLLGGAVVTETVFGINGLGSFIINSVKRKDIPAVTGGTVFLAIIFSFILLTVDILYAVVDPRIKARYSNKGGK
ncbi:MAG: ABC transporter permease [Firmicutes bacterium]|nr:ABC transporter permease [Bacillota bacterium]MBQ4233623.1 ABC transporter permease [Bacillota bacterium]